LCVGFDWPSLSTDACNPVLLLSFSLPIIFSLFQLKRKKCRKGQPIGNFDVTSSHTRPCSATVVWARAKLALLGCKYEEIENPHVISLFHV
jgi:hypothetical protein